MEILEIYDEYAASGISARSITRGPEFDMVRQFVDFRKSLFRAAPGKNLAVFLETKVNQAYPDVVFVEYDPGRFENWGPGRDRLTSADLKLLHFLYRARGGAASRRIAEALSLRPAPLLRSLEALADAGLLARRNGRWAIPGRETVFGVRKIEAVEAKIGKWEEALQQAVINRSFASESYVLSKRKRGPGDAVVGRHAALGVGLYLYNDGDRRFTRRAPAGRRPFPANHNSIYFNECIGRILNSRKTRPPCAFPN